MIGETITLKEVLDYMDGSEPFSIKFITCDNHKGTGGEEILIRKAWKHDPKEGKDSLKALALNRVSVISAIRRNPNHYYNSTRNLLLPNGQIRKLHIRLIRQFNGKTVL